MPFTFDAQSWLEQRLVVTMAAPDPRHVARSAHRQVAALMVETSRADWIEGDALGGVPEGAASAERAEVAAAVDGAEAPDVEAVFEALMARDLAVFEGGQRVKGMADDHQLDALARLHATALAELDARHSQSWVERTPLSAREAVVLEVATATGLPQGELSLRLELATGTPARTAFLREQIRTGATTMHRACELTQQTREFDDEVADHVARTILAPTRDGAALTGTLFRQRLRRALLTADLDRVGTAARRRAARHRNSAHAEILQDGTGRLTITNDVDKVAAAYDRADTAARTARAAGDPRTLDQLRADYLTGTAITGWPSLDTDPGLAQRPPSPPGHAIIVIPFDTAHGLPHPPHHPSPHPTHQQAPSPSTEPASDPSSEHPHDPSSEQHAELPCEQPCELVGHGYVSAEQARQIITAPGSIWQTLLADPTTGRAIALTRSYRPTPEMVEHVRAVDGTCRGPGCTIPARCCDLDHTTPWPHGPTGPDNLTATHRQHHRIKTAGWWTTTRDDDARITWHTAAARTYTTHPKDWLEGHHPADTPRTSTGAPPRAAPAGPDPDPPPF